MTATYWYGLTEIQAAAVHATAEAMGRNPGELAEELAPLLRMDAPEAPASDDLVLANRITIPDGNGFAQVWSPEGVSIERHPPTTELTIVPPTLDPPTQEIPVITAEMLAAASETK